MTFKNKSIFNLIEIFRSSPKRIINTIVPKTHCEQKQIHDYYCDAEKPHISQ
ncbi:hypothetical protein [uncultured Winogradskyella sp.]|uniref:hypothetical protein n=1 Tax=uncultured Winogradskyella sp. TaxID=395353 RepID=UPI0026199E07|nr:hypothetical protein [uncultured Winogradskyella sp.]